MLTSRFFLVNRELAGLVLDHLDHKTIGTFRLVCRSANVCAEGAFLRTSTRACFSEGIGIVDHLYTCDIHPRGCDSGLGSTSIEVSSTFAKAKMAN